MKPAFKKIQILFVQLFISLLFYSISKTLFFLFNHSYFSEVSILRFIYILFCGLRFDIAALLLTNIPFILLYMVPFSLTKKNWYQIILKTIFVTINSFTILLNCIDIEYYKFTLKRTTADFFHLFELGSDLLNLLPQFIIDFWYVVLIWIILSVALVYLYNKAKEDGNKLVFEKINFRKILIGVLLNVATLCLFVIGIRGGLQLRPIVLINANEYVSPKNTPLILNTPFSIIQSYGLEALEEKKYFSEEELKRVFNPIHSPVTSGLIENRPNVFIIILESFSKEYIGSLSKQKSYTPFLDSLIHESLVFDNAFANGKKSIEGIPAVLSGVPSLMNEAYITSAYGSNQFTSLAYILKEKGYSSAFFHGGTNGTMGFDAFCKAAGFDKYIGRFEYNNESDYDGDWGIWDEPFFKYTEKNVTQMKEPFLAALFSLSSHHPFAVPNKYKNLFQESELPIQKSIRYSDFALKQFFEKASKEKWFDNTLFILTADHTGPSNNIYYNNSIGSFEIPIIIYKHNSNLKGINHNVTQQIDIQPTILSYLNYNKKYFSFGNNSLDSSSTGYAINFFNNIYQIIQNDYCLQFDGTNSIGLYRCKSDSLLQNNLIEKDTIVENALEKKLKAIIQTYNKGMIHNTLIIKNY